MKKTRGFAALLCAAVIMTGCAKTPEQAIVREKGEQSTNTYKEAEPREPVSVAPIETGAHDKADRDNVTGAQQSTANEGSAAVGLEKSGRSAAGLAAHLQIPGIYEAKSQSEDGAFTLNCNAQTEIPAVDKISVYRVGQMEFSKEWIDRVTEAFFGDAAIYNGYTYNGVTKEEALKKLNQLKAWQTEGNTDPYGFIAGARESGAENPEQYYDIRKDIDMWEQTYAEAPETQDRTVVEPGLDGGFSVQEGGGDISVNNFIGMVELDGKVYRYQLKRYTSMPMVIDITNYGKDNPEKNWRDWYAADFSGAQEEAALRGEISRYEKEGMTQEKAEEMAGITPEEAQEIADSYMEKLGLSEDFSAKNVMISLCSILKNNLENINESEPFIDAAYQINYTRDIDGFPVTDEARAGGGLESMDSTTETWSYEKIEFTVNKDGIQHVEIHNLYDIGERKVENVELLSFPEVAQIFENMLRLQNSDMTYSRETRFDIDRVTLGYMRIYDPGADHTSGLLVPVWDFFGKNTDYAVGGDEESVYVYAYQTNSFLTINAADGTLIDRGLGY